MRNSVIPQERELHGAGHLHPLLRDRAVAVVRMDVNARVRLQDLVERPARNAEERTIPELVERVEFRDDDSEAAYEGIRRRQEHLVLATLDVDLQEKIRVEAAAGVLGPIVDRHEFMVRGDPDVLLREVKPFMGFCGSFHGTIRQVDVHSQVGAVLLEPGDGAHPRREARFDPLQVVRDQVTPVAFGPEANQFVAGADRMKLADEPLNLFLARGRGREFVQATKPETTPREDALNHFIDESFQPNHLAMRDR